MNWATAIGTVLGSAYNQYSSNLAWQRQKEYAQNAHQWEVEDLKKAGLNPILSANGGASLGSVSTAQDPGFASAGASLDNNKTARQLAKGELEKKDKEVEVMAEQIKKLQSDINVNNSAIAERDSLTRKYQQEIQQQAERFTIEMENARSTNAKLLAEVDALREETRGRGFDNQRRKVEARGWDFADKAINSAISTIQDKIRNYQRGGSYDYNDLPMD